MRKGFTLVELLVVLVIIAALAALIAFTLPGFQQRSRAAKGGQAVQAQLTYARQRAQYEQTPRGVRFHMEQNAAGWWVVRVMQMIEQPDDWKAAQPPNSTVGRLVADASNDPKYVKVVGGTNGDIDPGDYLEVNGTGQPHLIVAVGPSDPMQPTVIDKVQLADPGLPNALTSPVEEYRVMRAYRVSGDEPVRMPDEVVVDCDMFAKYAALNDKFDPIFPKIVYAGAVPQYFDIMFSPRGAGINAPGSKTILWVRVEKDTEFDHNPTLVVVSNLTGNVSAFDPVAAANPFGNVK